MPPHPPPGRLCRAALVAMAALWVSACTGTLIAPEGENESESDEAGGAPDAGMRDPDTGGGEPREVDIEGPAVQSHVQAFANAACGAVQACQPSTYEGHHPSADLALDFLVSDVYGTTPSDDNALGDTLADYVLQQQSAAGVRYLIWRQRYNDGSGWEPMEDRGSITQNHYDHVHVSFDESP